jgi:hypothetical protein
MTAAAAERLQSGHEIAGLVLVPQHAIRSVIAETIVMIGNCSDADEWVNTVDYLPWPAQNHER